MSQCYHCGEPLPANESFQLDIDGVSRMFCCPGCFAVAQTIVASGLTSYYKHRTAPSQKGDDLIPAELAAYDIESVQEEYICANGDQTEIVLSVEGITCAACAWLIEKQLRGMKGIHKVHVNSTSQRARVIWDKSSLKLSEIISAVAAVGYKALPFQAHDQEAYYQQQVKYYLRRIGVAALATMQVMMLAVALYADFFDGIEDEYRTFFRWVSLIFATPVLLYSAQPFYINAWRSLKARTLGMDVPVSIALLGAYVASAYATVMNTGEVYFESIAMFAFFLLVGRFFEMRVRRRAVETSANLSQLMPAMATLVQAGEQVQVAAKGLKAGQRILIRPGETCPADGVIIEGRSSIEESMLSGESVPVDKTPGDMVYTGTVNRESQLLVEVSCESSDNLLSHIIALQEQAVSAKPKLAILADKLARYFVGGLLVIAACTYGYWSIEAPEHAFWITLAVLVATCPCALSLATPTAITCATTRLNQKGVLIRSGHALDQLARLDRMAMDKTGTLTQARMALVRVDTLSDEYDEQTCLQLAAALEQVSEHPIARAFAKYSPATDVEQIENLPGQGIKGTWCGRRLLIGSEKSTVADSGAITDLHDGLNSEAYTQVYLSLDGQLLARFNLNDPLRSEAAVLVRRMHDLGIDSEIISGDQESAVRHVAQQLKIDQYHAGCSPDHKLKLLRQQQKEGHVIGMIGDGINDAPVLAGANVSFTVGSGSDLAKTGSDVLLLGDDLTKVAQAIDLARFNKRIIKQNLAWSLGYNLSIVPLAAMGMVAPYVAVAGMSASSILVVSNSLRLLKR